MLSEREKLDSLTGLSIELSRINDLDILMERILLRARQFANADAGSIYIREKDRLHFTYTQNDTLQKKLPEGEKLIYSTFQIPIDEKSIAGYVAATGRALNIPDAYKLEASLPYQFRKTIDETAGYKTQSILTIPLKNSSDQVLGVLQIINPQDDEKHITRFSESDERMMHHFATVATVALERAKMTRALILRMISMAEMRDPMETAPHANRVASVSVELYEQWAKRRGLDENEIEKNRDVLRMAAMLHDVGKVATSDLILNKPARLNADEYEAMKLHTVQGARLFEDQQSDFDKAAGVVALSHHERWDGNGYPGNIDYDSDLLNNGDGLPNGMPQGKKGTDIPLFGRIVALADVFDALSSERSYKEPWDEETILAQIERSAGRHFDPELVEIFFNRYDVIRAIHDRYKDKEIPD
ncbi:MAG: HD domain-containing protein [Desulfobacteraceae bacterium]|jgi:response regulator RpfG family c-di-GMP phosphodiesterase